MGGNSGGCGGHERSARGQGVSRSTNQERGEGVICKLSVPSEQMQGPKMTAANKYYFIVCRSNPTGGENGSEWSWREYGGGDPDCGDSSVALPSSRLARYGGHRRVFPFPAWHHRRSLSGTPRAGQ